MKAIIFDIDGTLWDVRKEVAMAWADVIRENTDWEITFDAARLGSLFGKTMTEIFNTLYPGVAEDEFARIRELIYVRQNEYLLKYKPALYEGMLDTIKALYEVYPLYIVTNAQSGYIETLFEATGIGQYFTDWMCFGDTNAPKNVTISRLMERNNITDAIYIGDTQGDAEACRLAGIPMIYASYGLGQVMEPYMTIEKPADLMDIFLPKIDTVIFDLDGTLLNTLEDLADAVNYVLAKENMPVRTLEEVRAFVGNGVARLMERAVVPGTSAEKINDMLNEYREFYAAHSLEKTAPYEGILDMLANLKAKGYKLGIVSNKFDKAVKDLNKHFFSYYIQVAIGEHEGVSKKPAPDMVMEALKELDSDAAHAVYVGDSEVDIQTAWNAGMRLIMVEWGFRDRAEMEKLGAKVFAGEADEVISCVGNVEDAATAFARFMDRH